MSHCYFHAGSSAKRFGGIAEDYLDIHKWFDASKRSTCDFRHRASRHHIEGVLWAEDVFGRSITNSDGIDVPVRVIGEQHIREDLGGEAPSLNDWLDQMETPSWTLSGNVHDVHSLSSIAATRFGGLPSAYREIHEWFLEPRTYAFDPIKALAIRHHSEGIFWCEETFGVTVQSTSGRKVPVRLIGELHVQQMLGRIPTLEEWVRNINPTVWMNHGYRMEVK